MKLRALLLIVLLNSMSGVVCAIVCPEDTSDSHASECTQCISTDVVVSTKLSDVQAVDTIAFSCTVAIDFTRLSRPRDAVDPARTSANPPFHDAAILPLRV
jgi:hypothetical protein